MLITDPGLKRKLLPLPLEAKMNVILGVDDTRSYVVSILVSGDYHITITSQHHKPKHWCVGYRIETNANGWRYNTLAVDDIDNPLS